MLKKVIAAGMLVGAAAITAAPASAACVTVYADVTVQDQNQVVDETICTPE